MVDRYAHCTFCGARFTVGQPWPRRCGACGETSRLSPTPVAVALQPVGRGLLVVRRSLPPGPGEPALPAGYVAAGETWQQATVRELDVASGLAADPLSVRLFDVVSAPDGTLLVFGVLPPVEALPEPRPDREISGLGVLTEPAPLAFPPHTAAAERFLAGVAAPGAAAGVRSRRSGRPPS